MRIAYMTNDEVNRALAVRLAGECGAVYLRAEPQGFTNRRIV